MKIKPYKKDFDYTYTLGVFETIELLKNRPDLVLRVYIKSNSYKNSGIKIIDDICRTKHIELIESDHTIQKLSKKDNCFALAIIKKYQMTLQEGHHFHSLVFGNESSGLPDEYLNYGQSVFIPHSHHIDSLNLSMALGITLAHFSKDDFKEQTVL